MGWGNAQVWRSGEFVFVEGYGSHGRSVAGFFGASIDQGLAVCQPNGSWHDVVSTQVLQEYYAAATRKLGVSPRGHQPVAGN